MSLSRLCPIFLSFSALGIILTLTCGATDFWYPNYIKLVPARSIFLYFALGTLALSLICGRFNRENYSFSLTSFALGLLFIFFSTWLYNNYGLLQAPSGRGLVIIFLLLFLVLKFLKIKINWSIISLSTLFLLIVCFIIESDGRLISADDHLTFLHRILLLKDNFPNIPIYDPYWNSGYDQRYFFATGALNFFFLLSPLIYLFDPIEIYNYCVILIIFVLPFFSIYAATRLLKFSPDVAWIAALIALAPCTEWYRWALQYGTLGFITTSSLLPICLALSIRILDTSEKFNLFYAVLLIITFTLMLFWSLSGFVFIPLIILAIIKVFSSNLLKKNYVSFVLISLLTLNLPWIAVFWSVSNVSKFVVAEEAAENSEVTEIENNRDRTYFRHDNKSFDFMHSLNQARLSFLNYNLILIFFALPGLFLIKRKYRLGFAMVAAWLAFLGIFLVEIKPQLELDRMLVMLSLILAVPAAAAVKKLDDSSNLKILPTLAAAITFGFLLATPISATGIIRNRTVVQYYFEGDFNQNISETIKTYQNKGRVLFSGCIIHEMNGGHLAPFTERTSVPLIASSPVHNLWWYTQIFPQEVLDQKEAGIQEYLDLNNVVAIFAHEPFWKQYFAKHPEHYQKIKTIGKFVLFERKNYENNYFLEGTGDIISQTNSSVVVRLKTNQAVIKFNYFPFLESDKCEISSHANTNYSNFIKISNCEPGSIITIKSKSAWKRIKIF